MLIQSISNQVQQIEEQKNQFYFDRYIKAYESSSLHDKLVNANNYDPMLNITNTCCGFYSDENTFLCLTQYKRKMSI